MQQFSLRSAGVASSAIREILKVTERPGMVSMAGGLPSSHLFPASAIREAFNRLLADDPAGCLQYGPTEGVRDLREWVAACHTSPSRPLTADHVLITTGSQQALDLIGKALVDPGDRVLVDNPTYLGAVQAFSLYGPEFVVFPQRDGDIDVDALASLPCKARLAYVVPNFHNPTGHLMPEAVRRQLAVHAQREGMLLVEDNPYGDLCFSAAKPPSLLSLCPAQVIHLGSFSKILAPGLRVGYVVAEPAIIRALALLKQAADLHTPSLNQRLVLALLQDGLHATQAVAARQYYRTQCGVMSAAIRRYFPQEVRVEAPQGGMFMWCELPRGIDAGELLDEAITHQVSFVPGAPFFVRDPQVNTLRLSFATVQADAIGPAISILGRLLHQHLDAVRC